VEPTGPHKFTLVLLHGFTSSGAEFESGLLAPLAAHLPSPMMDQIRFVFLNAPLRRVSCYGHPAPSLAAWHDYFTDHGGDEGRPELEEQINVEQLKCSRRQV
jgi:predicted alpha/beta-hydrolase family hydrolase